MHEVVRQTWAGAMLRFVASLIILCWALWVAGVSTRWLSNIYSWQWRIMLPLSAGLEVLAFLIFFRLFDRFHLGFLVPMVCVRGGPSETEGMR